MTAVGDALPGPGLARDLDLVLRPARLRGKGAAAALLAFEAVAHRNPHRLALAFGAELSAAARGRPDLHGHGSISLFAHRLVRKPHDGRVEPGHELFGPML